MYLSAGGATVVTWASGHLFELQKYTTWKLDKLPVLPSEWVFSCKVPGQLLHSEVLDGQLTTVFNVVDRDRRKRGSLKSFGDYLNQLTVLIN